MNGKTILWTIVAFAGIGAGYVLYKKFVWSKDRAIKYIMKVRGKDANKYEDYEGMDTAYLVARAKAMSNKESTFIYNKANYLTETGRLA